VKRAEVAHALSGDSAAIARLLTEIERNGGLDPEFMDELFQHTGSAAVVGVTGTPGAGKSTIVNALVGLVRASGRTAAVLAVDPSSPFTGGAVLGDRVRMSNATDPGVFVRSMASRGHLGGLALAAPAAIRLLDAAGTAVIFVETVGIGQNEVEVASVADCVVLVLGPAGGDEVQAMKAGVLEVADIVVVNKSDLPGAREARSHVAGAFRAGRGSGSEGPQVLLTSAESGVGLDRLLDAIEATIKTRRTSGDLESRSLERLRREVAARAGWIARDRVVALADESLGDGLLESLVQRERDPSSVAATIVDRLLLHPAAKRFPLLETLDPQLCSELVAEERRQTESLDLIASQNIVPAALSEIEASLLVNRAAVEGALGRRFHGGTAIADRIEALAVERAKAVFGAGYANVQPHSGVNANLAVYAAALEPGDRILAMSTKAGGHVSHATKYSLSGRVFDAAFYGVDAESELIDYEAVAELARSFRPKLIVAGSSSYPRTIDFRFLGEIAADVDASLHVDMAHIAGLVAGRAHPSPLPHARFVTATTYKTLRGAKGGFILGRADDAALLDRAIFPGTQGSTMIASIACKAYTFRAAGTPEFAAYAAEVVSNARVLAEELAGRGLRPVTGGTDTHLLVIDLRGRGLTGMEAQQRLESLGIDANRNQIPNDPLGHESTSGLRLGTSSVTTRGFGRAQILELADIIDRALAPGQQRDAGLRALRAGVAQLSGAFPIERGGR
jgi:glycine hydroxymethyltransferase